MITLLFTDGNLTPIGQPINRFKKVVATKYFNGRASVTASLPALGQYIEMAQPGNRLCVIRDHKYFVSGPIEYPGIYERSADPSSAAAGLGLLTVASTDDSVWLACRVCYPDPAHAAPFQVVDYYTASATNAETAMRALVDVNAGAGALTARRVPNLGLGSVASVGTNISVRTRFDTLTAQLDAAALAGGGLGYTVVQDGGALKFVVYEPTDLSGSARIGFGVGNMRNILYQPQAPTATVAIVGGDGTGTGRTIVERTNTSGVSVWGRIETWVNASGTDTTVLDQAGDAALVEAASQSQLTVEAIDTPSLRYGVHYDLGDKVSVEVYPGVDVTDTVRSVTLTADPASGEVVNVQIGSPSAVSDPQYVRMLRLQDLRLGLVERTRETT